jgi:hypothetical protein
MTDSNQMIDYVLTKKDAFVQNFMKGSTKVVFSFLVTLQNGYQLNLWTESWSLLFVDILK